MKRESTEQETATKKAYAPPALKNFGDVTQLVRGGGGSGNDAPSGATKMCWIAEALYGVGSPRTLLVRSWLRDCYRRRETWSLVIVPLYSHCGYRIAGFIRRYPSLQRVFRPLFDLAVSRAHREYAARAV